MDSADTACGSVDENKSECVDSGVDNDARQQIEPIGILSYNDVTGGSSATSTDDRGSHPADVSLKCQVGRN